MTTKKSVLFLTRVAILIAIIFILALTPIGYLRFGPVEATLMCVPVIVGAALLGPVAGGLLGLAFGITSLMQAPTHVLFGIVFANNPLLTAAICIIPRVLVGIIAAYVARLLYKFDKTKIFAFAGAGLVGSVLNTVLFLGAVIIALKDYTPFVEKMNSIGLLAAQSFIGFWVGIGTVNGIPEAIITAVLTAILCKALLAADKSLKSD